MDFCGLPDHQAWVWSVPLAEAVLHLAYVSLKPQHARPDEPHVLRGAVAVQPAVAGHRSLEPIEVPRVPALLDLLESREV
jgi:hypothetical protein